MYNIYNIYIYTYIYIYIRNLIIKKTHIHTHNIKYTNVKKNIFKIYYIKIY